MKTDEVMRRLNALPSDKVEEVIDFIEFLEQRGTPKVEERHKPVGDLRDIAESMKSNTFSGNPPRFGRDELHERR